MERFDAIVVGAGPAGATLALRLARAGRRCLVIDGARFPRPKVCGEGIMPAGLQVLAELGLGDLVAEVGAPFDGIRYRLGDGTRAEAGFPGGAVGRGVPRHALDARLVAAAQRAPNVTVLLGTWVRELRLPGPGAPRDEVEVVLGDAVARAPVLIGADGGRSLVRRAAGLEPTPPRPARFGVGAHFVAPREPDAKVEVFVGRGWELYTTPAGPELTCAALLLPEARLRTLQGDLEGGLRAALAEAGGRCAPLARAPLLARARALGPLALRPRAAHAERVLLVGDAAGALDPITGEGISLAFTTGRIAAEVLEGCYARGDFSARRLAEWTRRRAAAVRGLDGLTRLLLALAARPDLAARVVRNLARAPESFERVLAVAAGMAPLGSLRLRDGLKLLLGV